MSFLGKIITNKIVKKTEKDILESGLELITEMAENKSADQLLHDSLYKNKLVAKFTRFSKFGYKIYDDKNCLVYIIKSQSVLFNNPKVVLFDSFKRKIGYIQKNKKNIKADKYIIYFDNHFIGCAIDNSKLKFKIDFDFNGWYVRSNFFCSNYQVFDKKDKEIIRVNEASDNRKTYFIEYDNQEIEIMSLLVLMIILAKYEIE